MNKLHSSTLAVVALFCSVAVGQTTLQLFREHFDKGKEQVAAQNWEAAAAEFEAAHALNRSEPATIKNLAYCYSKLKQFDKAEPLRRELCEASRADEDCLPHAELLITLGRYADAIAILDQIQSRSLPNVAAVESRFRCYAYMELDQPDKAVPACRGGEPDGFPPIAQNLLVACMKIGDIDCARDVSQKLSQKSPKDWVDIGKLWIRSAPEEARKAFIPGYVATAPDLASRRAIGIELAKKALWEESTPILEKVAAEAGGDGCDVAEALARGYFSAKEDAKAMTWTTTLITCSPDSAVGYAMRGAIHYRAKDVDKAIADFEKSLSITADERVQANLESAQRYKQALNDRKRAEEEAKAEARWAQEEYKRRLQKDKEDYCRDHPNSPECKEDKSKAPQH